MQVVIYFTLSNRDSGRMRLVTDAIHFDKAIEVMSRDALNDVSWRPADGMKGPAGDKRTAVLALALAALAKDRSPHNSEPGACVRYGGTPFERCEIELGKVSL